MKRPCQAKYNRVTQAAIQEIPRQLPERDSPHRAAESHHSGYRSHDALWIQVGRQHDDKS